MFDATDPPQSSLRASLNNAMRLLCGRPLLDDDYSLIPDQHAQENRTYHGIPHSHQMGIMSAAEKGKFIRDNDITDPARTDRLEALINVAGGFHDNVYLQLDGDVSDRVKAILSKYINVTNEAGEPSSTYTKDNVYRLRPSEGMTEQEKSVRDIVCGIFGIDPQDSITPLPPLKDGAFINEFLSTLVATDTLKRYEAADTDIAQVAAIIEGTIPYRNANHFNELADRLRDTNQAMRLGMDDTERMFAIKSAVFLANKDVLGFIGSPELSDEGLTLPSHEERLRKHLQVNWSLIPELNPIMRTTQGGFTATDFREDLLKGRRFEAVFLMEEGREVYHQYDGYPRPEDFSRMKELESDIRKDAVAYTEAKIVAAAVVEALAVKSKAGQAPLLELLGKTMHLDIQATAVDENNPIFKMLRQGRGDSPAFDLTDSPIAARIVGAAGIETVQQLYTEFLNDKDLFNSTDNKRNSTAFLIAAKNAMGEEAFKEIAGAMENVARKADKESRAARIRNAANEVVQHSTGPQR